MKVIWGMHWNTILLMMPPEGGANCTFNIRFNLYNVFLEFSNLIHHHPKKTQQKHRSTQIGLNRLMGIAFCPIINSIIRFVFLTKEWRSSFKVSRLESNVQELSALERAPFVWTGSVQQLSGMRSRSSFCLHWKVHRQSGLKVV